MKVPVTKDYLDGLRQKLIDAEEEEPRNRDEVEAARSLYYRACAWAYSAGDLKFVDDK